ncbi:MAG: CARDB domain-containing protein [Bacteroidota bacterium]
MKTYPVCYTLILVCLFACQQQTENDFKKLPKAQRVEAAFQLEFEKTRDLKTNTIPSERLLKARAYADQKRQEKSILDLSWEERGPNNVGGRTRVLMYDLNDPIGNTVFAGGVGGGLWKTTNIDASQPDWQAIDDFWENIAISAIAQDPQSPNLIYVGTGEGWYNGGAIRGNGIWKSADGGDTFEQLPSTANDNFNYVNKLVVHADGVLLAATRSRIGSNGGIYKSEDGGATWNKVLSSIYTNSIGCDLEIAADGAIYAAIYFDGIYKSTNGGNTWNKVYAIQDAVEGRIELATAPSDKDVVYALFQSRTDGIFTPIRKTVDGGNNWVDLSAPLWIDFDCNNPTPDWTRGQDWYDLIAGVHPNNADIVYIGGIDLFKSTDGGQDWTQISHWFQWDGCGFPADKVVHADQHAITFHPNDSNEMLFGHDGGVSRTINANAPSPSFQFKSDNYNVTQFYAVATSNEIDANNFLAGSQDNGTQYFTASGMNSTREVTGGDGAFCHIDQDNPDIQISSYIYNNYRITNNGWDTHQRINMDNEGRFINPTDYDSDANILYGAHEQNTYSFIKDVGSNNSTGTQVITDFDGTVSAVTVSPNTPNRVFFGTAGGNIIRVDDAHQDTPRSSVLGTRADRVNGFISCIAVEVGNDDHLLVTYSNYGLESIWESQDGGENWRSVEGNLPDMPVRWIAFMPNRPNEILIATEVGVWYTDFLDGEATDWKPSNNGLANTRVDMLKFRNSDNFLLAATHGRGLFSTDGFQGEIDTSTMPDLACEVLGTLEIVDNEINITELSIVNLGADMQTSAQVGYYLSLDENIDAADLLIGTSTISPLDSSESSLQNFNETITEVENGTYYVGIRIDYQNRIRERNEDNNTCHWETPQLTIDIGMPNLVWDFTGSLNVTGNRVEVRDLGVKNAGNAEAPASYIAYYLSTDDLLSQEDIFIGEDFVRSLDPDEVSFESFTETLTNVPVGTYFLMILADYTSRVEESDETDNICYFPAPQIIITDENALPNLRCDDLGTMTFEDQTLRITDLKIINDGTAEARSSDIAYYLSTNTTISDSDIFLGDDFVRSLDPGERSTESFTADLSNITAGTYYVGIVVDYEEEVAESIGSDNECYYPTPITISEDNSETCACTSPTTTNICEDFQSYTLGKIGPQSDCWTTWSGQEGGIMDGDIQQTENNKYLNIWGTLADGGPQDVVLQLGDRTSGKYEFQFYLFAFEGEKAYYSILQGFNPTSNRYEWGQEVVFHGDGRGTLTTGGVNYDFDYNPTSWIQVYQYFDLDNDEAWYFIDGELVHSWTFSDSSTGTSGRNNLAAANFYPLSDEYIFYIDNMSLEEVDGVRPNPIEQRQNTLDLPVQQSGLAFSLSPNPSTGQFQIELEHPLSTDFVVEITDVSGRLVRSYDSQAAQMRGLAFDLSDQANGVYYVRLQTATTTVVRPLLLAR